MTLFEPERLSVMPFYYTKLTGSALLEDFGHAWVRAFSLPITLAALFGWGLLLKRKTWIASLWIPIPLALLLLSFPTGLTPTRYLLPFLPLVDGAAANCRSS